MHDVRLSDYEPFVGRRTIEEITRLAEKLAGRVIQHVNSTHDGGGVAEILRRMIPLMRQLGMETRWNIIKGDQEFFRTTKKFHNAIQGRDENIQTKEFSQILEPSQGEVEDFLQADFVVIHDPQPISLVSKRMGNEGKWVWRCHIDVSDPPKEIWSFIQEFIVQYDAAIFSAPGFAQELPVRQYFIAPSIDPLSDKNRELTEGEVDSVLRKYNIPQDKPIITQVSRFDHFKDPVGVIQAFEMVRKEIDCQLVLAGGTASDDPESEEVLAKVMERAAGNPYIHVLSLPPDSDIEINALQRASAVIVQKSLKEGFGLTVSEAMWKRKPVVASAVGGIVLQIENSTSGLLCHNVEGTATAIRQLLSDPAYARQLGENGRERVRQQFLITRHLKDYLSLFLTV
ncbi:MAG: glycosyltransferase [Chloroflexi bacterium]|nr:glycosyltransferase [Chloroflexota bacterium]